MIELQVINPNSLFYLYLLQKFKFKMMLLLEKLL